ncbi:MAG: hypothetical protein CSB48_00085 [Proteobacteria bacterium]|nr:MAG: hypothetical protein CSB48_00085 [Pseudomonadota bacterium]
MIRQGKSKSTIDAYSRAVRKASVVILPFERRTIVNRIWVDELILELARETSGLALGSTPRSRKRGYPGQYAIWVISMRDGETRGVVCLAGSK